MSNIQIPMIFDATANGTIYGESIAEDVVTAHFKFTLESTVSQAETFITAMQEILYADEPDSSTNGVLFYKKATNTHETIGSAIKKILFGTESDSVTQLIKHAAQGATAEQILDNFGYAVTTATETSIEDRALCAGIPIGKDQKNMDASRNANIPGGAGADNTPYYQSPFIDSTGATIPTVLIRIAATHLMGHPFAQGFIQENTISSDLYNNADFEAQLNAATGFNLTSCTPIAGGAGTIVNHVDGEQIAILQTIYEQLLQVNPELHREPDEDVDNDGDLTDSATQSKAQSLTFKKGNTVTFYIRPRLFLKLDTVKGITEVTNGTVLGETLARSGITYNGDDGVHDTNPENTFAKIFTSGSGDGEGYYWLTVKDNHGNGSTAGAKRGTGEALSQWTSNYQWSDVQSEATGDHVAVLDAHIWKIVVTLKQNP